MRILSMTATFGKLSHETLTLKPGLNVIEAPNEWGKSTWCAFILAMLYGIDTSSRSKKDFLADKVHYTPWSGEPMGGRMDVLWKEKRVTLERSSKGRTPMGEFRAYETDTGIPIKELTGDNCGQMLLGAEKSVFLRAGFLQLQDLPLTQDEALRERLNGLVTTGDESGTVTQLDTALRELKNQCRYRNSGKLPQALRQREELMESIGLRETLLSERDSLQKEQGSVKQREKILKNHLETLKYAQVQEGAEKRRKLEKQLYHTENHLEQLKKAWGNLPCEAELLEKLSQKKTAGNQMQTVSTVFAGLEPDEAVRKADADFRRYMELQAHEKAPTPFLGILGMLLMLGAGILLAVRLLIPGIVALVLGMGAVLGEILRRNTWKNRCAGKALQAQILRASYGSLSPERWVQEAQSYAASQSCGCEENSDLLEQLEACRSLQQEQQNRDRIWELLAALPQEVFAEPPKEPDSLTLSQEETRQQLEKNRIHFQKISERLGACQGKLETIGEGLEQKLTALNERIRRLEMYDRALEIALETSQEASRQLQRRFAPRISQRTQELFSRLTGGKYEKIIFGEDFALQSAGVGENTMRSVLWRSDGTADQIYLAARLAVTEELTPQAPFILDDALVRFDDKRLSSALDILKEVSKEKQVVLFTCQRREKSFLLQNGSI